MEWKDFEFGKLIWKGKLLLYCCSSVKNQLRATEHPDCIAIVQFVVE